MAPTRKARSLYKQSYTNEVSPIRHGDGADRRTQRKRKLSDMLGPQWSKDELKRFYEAYRKYGKDWKKVGAVIRNRSIEMVEALYTMNRAYLSLPEGTASLAGLIAMMSDHYSNQAQSDYEQESNDRVGTSLKPEKHSPGKVQPKIYKGSGGRLPSHSLEVSSSYGYQPLMKKKRSGGNRPRVVGKRTPRFPVSYSSENVNGESHFSPSRQGLKFKFDGKDDKVAHGRLIALAEASQKGGSPQLSCTPKTMVRSSDMDEDALEGKMQPDGGDISRDVHYLMQTRSTGALSPKGRRFYGKKLGVDSSKDKQLNTIKEACGGKGQIMGVDSGKSYSEITDAVIGTSSSYGSRKRSKQVLFNRDEDSAFDALQTLADLSLRLPESTNDGDSFVQINEDSSDTGKPKSVEAMPEHQQKEKRRVLGFEIEEHHLSSRSKCVIDKSSQLGKASVGIVSPSPEAMQETHESTITQMSRKRQKTMTFKVSKQTDAHINESHEAEAADVGKSPSKGKWSSKGASPMLVKHSENSSLYADTRKEGSNSAVFTVDVPITDQVEKITKVRSRRKMKLQKPQILADSNLLDKTKKLSNCFSNHQARRWCAFEWFYSAIDYPWFAKREFVEYLFHVGLGHVPKLTRVEWGVIRSSLGKPRRYSEQFLKEEKEKLNQYRDSVRKHYTELRSGTRGGLPTDLAKPLSVGQRVTAIHPKTREINDGSVLTVDHNRCRVQFDLPELGVEFVMDIDCMPLNPLENMPTSLARHAVAVDKFLESFSKLKVNGHTEIDRQEGYLKFAPGGILDNMDIESLAKRSNYVVHNLSKKEKVAFTNADSHSNIGPQKIATSQQVACSQPLSQEPSQAIEEADVQAVAELTRVLDRKQVLVSGLREMNNDVENQKDGDVALKDSELFIKQYAAVLIQLREVDERVSSVLYCLRQRNTYKGNLSLTWPRSVTDTGDFVGVMSFLNNSEIHIEESPESHVNEIVESSRTTARMMVDSAIKAYSSMMGAENTFEKIEETIDYVSDQLVQPTLEDSYIPAGRFSNAAEHGSLACQEKSKCRTVFPLQADVPSPKLGNPSPVPSELVAKCVATLLMIQKCTERQFPPADVAQILNSAVASLQPCSSQNLPVYADIERCMVMIRNQIMALIPT